MKPNIVDVPETALKCKEIIEIGNPSKNGDHTYHRIMGISENNEKCPAVTTAVSNIT